MLIKKKDIYILISKYLITLQLFCEFCYLIDFVKYYQET